MKQNTSRGFVPVESKKSTSHLALSKMVAAPALPNSKLSTETVTLQMPQNVVFVSGLVSCELSCLFLRGS